MKRISFILITIIFLSLNVLSQTRQDVIDDGYTWFEAINGEALCQNNIPV